MFNYTDVPNSIEINFVPNKGMELNPRFIVTQQSIKT